MAFETFKRQHAPLSDPAVTIQKRGTISLNASAYEAMGSPKAVELLYDREAQLIGFRKAAPSDEYSYVLRPLGKGSTWLLSGTAFVAHYGISTEVARRWLAHMKRDVLVIDLKNPGIEVAPRGGRTPSVSTT